MRDNACVAGRQCASDTDAAGVEHRADSDSADSTDQSACVSDADTTGAARDEPKRQP